jgi:hypothetical protein
MHEIIRPFLKNNDGLLEEKAKIYLGFKIYKFPG